ncbi:MAG: hypothetical protein LLG01_15485 [Planctomycetaceae bacterium]|nr:hypothetical protein [Planctomycetaceae bacterium]
MRLVLMSAAIIPVFALAMFAGGCNQDMANCPFHAMARPFQGPSAMSLDSTVTFVNERCPIMGSTIDPDKVPASLVRDYKGKKVAFCCGGCPGQWDKLSDVQKDEKLRAATKS